MKKIIFACFFFAFAAIAFAQKETFDMVTYTPPKGWKKKVTENIITHSIINKTNNSWCQVAIIRSTNSKGSIEKDFKSEWQEFIGKNYKPTEPQTIEKNSYSFYINFDEAIKQTVIMLQASAETKRDGKYNAEVESKKMWRYMQAPAYIVIKLPGE